MPKAFTEQERRAIAQGLLEQGAALFSAYGLKKTSVEELAGAVGISKAAFYLFYPSKEALFMEVIERAEEHFRQDILAALDLPGPSPRARLASAFRRAFTLWRTIPVLRFFSSSDYELIARRIAPEIIQEHLASDARFLEGFAARCQASGIPVKVAPQDFGGLMYVLFFTSLHDESSAQGGLTVPVDLLTELVAAYCLGEISIPEHLTNPEGQNERTH